MEKICIGLILLFSSLGYGQKLSEAGEKMAELKGTWKTEVEGSSLALMIDIKKKEEREHFQITLININGEKFMVNESEIISPSQSEYNIKVIKAGFEQYKDCEIKNAVIDLKKLEDQRLSFSYHSEISDCSFGSRIGLNIPDVDGLIFKREK